ncbi:MAG: polyprenyl glycosylphosphotransferase [Verrucomicrobia bacterium]|nr:MAG: polyprenyl glycosylphosphotransferase [Verrucomicrobiota bacterium]
MFSRPSQNPPQSKLLVEDLSEPPVWDESAFSLGSVDKKSRGTLRSVGDHDWIAALLYVVCDTVCWVVLYGIVGYIRRDQFFVSPFEFVLVDCVVLAVILQALYIIGGYNRNTEMRGLIYTAEHILAVVAAAGISSLLIYSAATFDAGMKPSRGVLLISFIFFLPISLTYRRFFRQLFAASAAQRAFLVIGSGELATRFYEAYKQSPNQQQLEFVDNDVARVGSAIAGAGSPIVQGGIGTRLAQLDGRYSGVILAESIDRLGPELLERLVRTQFQRTRVYTLESFHEAHWRHVPIHTIDPFWPLQMGFQLARISPYHYLKRLFDVIFSAVLLLISIPLFPLILLLIWMESGRPAIFRQSRVGREGHIFTAYKFRTMFMRDLNEETTDLYTRKDDPRVTHTGRSLRKLRLDELPQLWNVFKGDMSLIGPRAEWIKCAERYQKKIPFYHFRQLVKPGITGWAQVNYPYGESDEDTVEKLQYDLYYIRHYSLKLDAMIVLKTVHTMLCGKGR